MAHNATHGFLKAWSLAFAMVAILSCCTNCTPYTSAPSAVINKFEPTGDVMQGNNGEFIYNVTKSDGLGNVDYIEFWVDANKNLAEEDSEITKITSYNGGDAIVSTTNPLNVPGELQARLKVVPNDNSSEVYADSKTNVIKDETAPTVSLDTFDYTNIEGRTIESYLPDIEGVTWADVEVTGGPATISEFDPITRKVKIKANRDLPAETSYNLTFRYKYTDKSGDEHTVSIERNNNRIKNLCSLVGRIESNGDSVGVAKAGDIVAYADSNETDPAKKAINYSTPDGNFNVQANQPTDELLVRARFNEFNYEGDNKSFTREVLLDATKDYSNLVLTCEPSPNPATLPVTKAQFADWINATGGTYLLGWDLTTFEGIEILSQHPEPSKGAFNSSMQNAIAERCKASDGVEALFDNKISLDTKVQIDDENTRNFHYYYNIAGFSAHPNWIIVVPVYNLADIDGNPCAGLTGVQYLNNNFNLGVLNGAVIEIDASRAYLLEWLKGVGMHEFNHATISPHGEGTKIVNSYSVMGNRTDAGSADVKKAHMVYNWRYNRMEEYPKILRLKF